MAALERSIAAASPGRHRDWAAGVEGVLAEMVAVLHDHVTETEGEDGLFERVGVDAPRLTHAIDVLREDHERIAAAVTDLRAQVEEVRAAAGTAEAAGSVERVRSEALDLFAVLARHRHRGADLLYEAYSVDVGTGD